MRVIVCVCLSVYVCACVYVFVCVCEYILEVKAPIVDFIWRFEMILDLGLEIAHEFLQSTYVLVWVRTLPPHSAPVCCGVLHHVAACSKCSELLSSPYCSKCSELLSSPYVVSCFHGPTVASAVSCFHGPTSWYGSVLYALQSGAVCCSVVQRVALWCK